MSTTYAKDRLSQRHAVGQKAQVASTSSAAAVALRALLANPELVVGPTLRSETSAVIAWLDLLAACSDRHDLTQLVDESRVTNEQYTPVSLIARALTMKVPPPKPSTSPSTARVGAVGEKVDAAREDQMRRLLDRVLDSRSGITVDGDTLVVVNADKASVLAQHLEQISNSLVEDAYGMDRERSGQFAIA